MNYKQISELLEKYWEGETTLQEERLLKTYFNSENVDERLTQYQPLFAVLNAEKNVEPTKTILAHHPAKRVRLYWYAAAASLIGLLAVGTWWFTQKPIQNAQANLHPKLYQDTYDDPEKAAAEIKAALALVSSKMRKGKKEAQKGLKKVEAVDKYFIKTKLKN